MQWAGPGGSSMPLTVSAMTLFDSGDWSEPDVLATLDETRTAMGGRIVADGPTLGILGDAGLLAAHDLELPHGFVMDHH